MALAVPLAVLLGVLATQVGMILVANGGVLTYTLDDPYIHLALAEQIAKGTYGVNPGEFAAPSSSILWPFLLVPWARTPVASYVPLLINFAAAIAVVVVFHRIVVEVVGARGEPRRYVTAGIITTALIPLTHLTGLVLNGMEHVLQVLLVALAVWGLWRERERGDLPPWLLLVLVAGPLVRYEMLAVSVPALVLLFGRGHRRSAVTAGVLIGALIGAFSLFLLAQGAGPLPNSVVVKSVAARSGLAGMVANLATNVKEPQGPVFMVGVLVVFAGALSARRPWAERVLALWASAVGVLHLFGGRFGWLERYEIYAWSALLLTGLLLYRDPLRRFVSREPHWKVGLITVAFIVVTVPRYVIVGAKAPHVAHNIYDQHYQLHRFVTEVWQRPVAANDIGWLSFRNPYYVLDVEGLASIQALRNRGEGPAWVTPEAARHDVRLGIVHPNRRGELPPEWLTVGTFVLTGERGYIVDTRMGLYARDAAAASDAQRALERFRPTLPPGAHVETGQNAPRPTTEK
jgi:hypothetical protein